MRSFDGNRWRQLVCIGFVCAAGCAKSTSGLPDAGGDIPGLIQITVDPADQQLVIDGDTPATATYRATGQFEDGHTEDISDRVAFSLEDSGLGSFARTDLTSNTSRGGRTQVLATAGSVQGSTGLVLQLRQRYSDPESSGLPADPEGLFERPDNPGKALQLVYPNNGVLVPPNLSRLEFHFVPSAGQTVFELSFENAITDVRVYAQCTLPMNGGCIYTVDRTVWQWLSRTNRGEGDLEVRVRGSDGAGSSTGASATNAMSFSFDDIKGGVYYWNTSDGTSIMRYAFGDTDQITAERFVGPESAGGKCVGCHALSRDGSKVVTAAGGFDVEDILLVDVATKQPMGAPARSAFASWNPDGSQYVGVFAYEGTTSYNLMLFDGDTGASAGIIDVGATQEQATSHPDWSPDGSRIVYTQATIPWEGGVNNQLFYGGAIRMVERQGAGWSAPIELVPSQTGKNQYYPSFSPGGQLIAFDRSTCPGGIPHSECDADSDPTATMYVIQPGQNATPIELARANAPGATDTAGALTNSWPKWAPFEFEQTQGTGAKLNWITFSSTRKYGLRDHSGTLLWMAAVDVDRALNAQDPSYPAFALPFQDLTGSNHIAQWTEQVVALP